MPPSVQPGAKSLLGSSSPSETGSRLWRIDLGSQTSCRITVEKVQARPVSERLMLYEQATAHMIRQAEVEVESTFKIEAVGDPPDRLTFSVSKSLEIASVSYDGDLQLSWRYRPGRSERRRLVEVVIPTAGAVRRHTVRLRGFVLSAPRGKFTLPQIVLPDAVLQSGRVTISVESPLILRSFRGQGVRQTQPIWQRDSAQHLVLEQFMPQASLVVNVGVPRTDLRATALTHVVLGPQRWQLWAEVEWTCKSGSIFSAACQLPPEWEITDVRMRESLLGNDLVNWSIQSAGEAPVLRLQFRDALTPGTPKGVVILAKQLSAPPNVPVHLPAVIPLWCDEFDSAVVMTFDPDHSPVISSETDFETAELESLAAKWKDREVWKRITSAKGMRQIVLRALSPTNVGVFVISGAMSESSPPGTPPSSPTAALAPDTPQSSSAGASPRGSDPAARVVRILITSRFPVASEGRAQHAALLKLVNWPERQGLTFRLAPFSKLDGVLANGKAISIWREGPTFVVPPLRSGVLKTLTIRYTTTAQRRLLRARFLVDVPQLDERVVEVNWRVILPRQFELGGIPASLCLRMLHQPVPWPVRFFGPIGRPNDSAVFNPASWQ
ncbi:MAG TPA: hypothetical protein EYP14_18655, partial [Planctomycetaceae bacterium]|nr:hypothetical protein [Planctomycetaceae bacterium]